jgi:1-acyl-sn-glycerol-3-phosphate acyltransferase
VRIVDDRGQKLDERREGQLEFRGPSATRGYFQNAAKTREMLHDGWLASGDRAYVANGCVFITGRIKDIVIRGGQHIYPHEIEDAVGSIPGARKGGAAMFGVPDPGSGTERIVVVAETDSTDPASWDTLRIRAREATVDAVGVAPDDIVLVRPGTIPKTQSGKIRRAAARELYLTGRLEPHRTALKWQMLRLSFAGLPMRIVRAGRKVSEMAYAAWWWFILAICFIVGAVAILMLPGLSFRWRSVRGIARLALLVVGATPSVSGAKRIPLRGAVLMFNHSSYADALVLAAVLPGEPAYLAKKEFSSQLLIGRLLRRLGVLFVERYELAGSLADIAAATASASRDRVLVVFPEGTFTRRPGLSGFYLGGFKIAAEAGLAVVPGALRGTRTMLRSDQWLPQRCAVSVDFGEPIQPTGKEFTAILQLRDVVRQSILARCGEPDLNVLIKPAPPVNNTIA